MSKPSIYSKTLSQLRLDLAQAGRNANPKKQINALSESIGRREADAKSMKNPNEEEVA